MTPPQPPTASPTSEHQPIKLPERWHKRYCSVCGVEWPCLARKTEVIEMLKAKRHG